LQHQHLTRSLPLALRTQVASNLRPPQWPEPTEATRGTLPDFGNFRIKDGKSYDSYRGIKKLMQWEKGVSVKDVVWDDKAKQSPLDYDRMLKIVLDTEFSGYCGIEHGGFKGLNASRKALEDARDRLS
jgi:hypothetical protein